MFTILYPDNDLGGFSMETCELPETKNEETAIETKTVDNKASFADKDFETILAEIKAAKDKTHEFDPEDIEANKMMGMIAYLSWLVLIPIFAARNSKFARYHANQGIVLAIIETGYILLSAVVNSIVYEISLKYGTLVSTILTLCGMILVILAVIGIVNALKGKAKEIPAFGSIKILK